MSNEFVTVVNRTSQTLSGMYDGRPYEFAPNSKQEHPKHRAVKFVEQNPVMGSEDARTGSTLYKLGIPEYNMPCDPLTDEDLAQFGDAVEKWDRKTLTGSRPSEVVKGDNGLYSRRDASQGSGGLPTGGNFVDPSN